MTPDDSIRPQRRPPGILVPTAGTWGVVWLVTVVLNVARQRLEGRPIDLPAAATLHLPILALWLVATPFILSAGRRWPLRPDPKRVGAHALAGAGFVTFTNMVIRMGTLLGNGPTAWLRETGLGLVTYLPPALLLYLGVVWIGGRNRKERSAAARDDGSRARGTQPLVFKSALRTHLLRPDEILWAEADNNHVVIHCSGGKRIRIRERLSHVEGRLGPLGFLRIHRSTLARMDAIRELQPLGKGDWVAVLNDGTELRVARSRRSDLESALGAQL